MTSLSPTPESKSNTASTRASTTTCIASHSSSAAVQRALVLPEILHHILCYLRHSRSSLRSLRQVSRLFCFATNRIFRLHLTAVYALENNCITQEGASGAILIERLNFQHHTTSSIQRAPDHHGCFYPERGPEFCALVKKHCRNLETIKVALGNHHEKEQVLRMFSTLFSSSSSKNDEDRHESGFRLKELEIVFGVEFEKRALDEIRRMDLAALSSTPSLSNSPLPPPHSLGSLETLTLDKQHQMQLVHIYKILQLKLGPEIAAATSFLGPVFPDTTNEPHTFPSTTALTAPVSTVPFSRTLKNFFAPRCYIGIDQLYSLVEQAPNLEELQVLTINNVDTTMIFRQALVHHSKRPSGSLRLRRLRIQTICDTYLLLLFRILDPTLLESFETETCGHDLDRSGDSTGEEHVAQEEEEGAGFPANFLGDVTGRLLNQLRCQEYEHDKQRRLQRQQQPQLQPQLQPQQQQQQEQNEQNLPAQKSHQRLFKPGTTIATLPRPKPFTTFGIGDIYRYDRLMQRKITDWTKSLRDIHRLYYLQDLTLPLSVYEFLENFEKSLGRFSTFSPKHKGSKPDMTHLTNNNSRSNNSVHDQALAAEFRQEQEEDVLLEQYPFPACLTLKSLTLSSCCDLEKRLTQGEATRFGRYLVRWLPQLEHLYIKSGHFPDFGILETIGPPPEPSSASETFAKSLQEQPSHGHCRDGKGLAHLKSLELSFEFLSTDEYLNLPDRESIDALIQRFHIVVSQDPLIRQPESLNRQDEILEHIRLEKQLRLLKSRPIEVHEGRVDQVVALLGRWLRQTHEGSILNMNRLEQVQFLVSGMPEEYIPKIRRRVSDQFPELELNVHSFKHPRL
ncbi:hypothetical protein BGZ83_010288 [Gryganskiella cystojenkinii]|nr:hypothetical protein BGZ83_010288 [Gryganskiella cystojenkinii]